MTDTKVTGNTGAGGEWGEILQHFVGLVIKSPIAIVTIVLSWFLGFGISFILFDYRRYPVRGSHYYFHSALGLGYAALIFVIVNWDLVSSNLTLEQVAQRVPLTLLVGFSVGFLLMVAGAIWRQRTSPYTGG
jgi:uncharacterized membrane protein